MDQYLAILAISTAILIGAVSPGPSFVVVAKASLSRSRQEAIAVSLGIGVGSALFALIALAGLHVVFEQVKWLYLAFKIGGGLYLVYIAYKIFSGAKAPIAVDDTAVQIGSRGLLRAFFFGFVTQMSNPKTAVVFAGIFAIFLTETPSPIFYMTLLPIAFLIDAGWYCLVSTALSSERPRRAYGRMKGWIDRTAAAVMGGLGISLIGEAVASTE